MNNKEAQQKIGHALRDALRNKGNKNNKNNNKNSHKKQFSSLAAQGKRKLIEVSVGSTKGKKCCAKIVIDFLNRSNVSEFVKLAFSSIFDINQTTSTDETYTTTKMVSTAAFISEYTSSNEDDKLRIVDFDHLLFEERRNSISLMDEISIMSDDLELFQNNTGVNIEDAIFDDEYPEDSFDYTLSTFFD